MNIPDSPPPEEQPPSEEPEEQPIGLTPPLPPVIYGEELDNEANAIVVIVSDLHLGAGGIAGDFDAEDAVAYEQMLGWVETLKAEYPDRPLHFVLLGDVFDLWEVPPPAPEGTDPRTVAKAARIAERKARQLAASHGHVFGSGPGSLFPLSADKKVYVWGNHDDDARNVPGVREAFEQALGLPAGTLPFSPSYDNAGLRLHAEHGHAFDGANRSLRFGEVQAGRRITERVSGHLERLRDRLRARGVRVVGGFPYAHADAVGDLIAFLRCFSGLRNFVTRVRVKWNVAEAATGSFLKRFGLLRFVLQPLIWLVELIVIAASEIPLLGRYVEGLLPKGVTHPDLDDAEDLLERLSGVRCVVMGHTHGPLIERFSATSVYVNTGSWQDRARVSGPPSCAEVVPHREVALIYGGLSGQSTRTGYVRLFRFFGPSRPTRVASAEYDLS